MNKRDEEDFVMEMIDRAFVNVDWVNAYTNYALRNLPIIRSNYGPIILDFEYLQPFKRRPFRFERMWLCHPTCKSMVQQAWNSHTVGSRTFQLRHKLLSALGTKRFLERQTVRFTKSNLNFKLFRIPSLLLMMFMRRELLARNWRFCSKEKR